MTPLATSVYGKCCNMGTVKKYLIYTLLAKYITHCGYSIENNIAIDIRLSRNVVNKESKSSRRFVCICNTSSGDNNYCKQGSFILYGRTGGAVHNSIDNWNNNAQCLLVDAHGWMRTIRRHDTRRPASQHRSIPFSRRSEPAARWLVEYRMRRPLGLVH